MSSLPHQRQTANKYRRVGCRRREHDMTGERIKGRCTRFGNARGTSDVRCRWQIRCRAQVLDVGAVRSRSLCNAPRDSLAMWSTVRVSFRLVELSKFARHISLRCEAGATSRWCVIRVRASRSQEGTRSGRLGRRGVPVLCTIRTRLLHVDASLCLNLALSPAYSSPAENVYIARLGMSSCNLHEEGRQDRRARPHSRGS